uniref:DUF7041 domain-containing protein n=1 Tax=Trichogramma kaykai TaxID=54128 RepID=A0ABD2W928_9HYME
MAAAASIELNSLKFPSIFRIDIEVWFVQVETYFELLKALDDVERYKIFITQCEPEVLLHVANYVRRQGSFGSYAELKNQLRLVYGRSPRDQLNSIIELHKNHRQPSFVIAAMKRWDDGRHSEKDLASIFLKHVNDYTVNLNKLNDIEKLDQLAEIVDQVASHKGVFKQDQSSGKLYVLNQIRDLLRILSPNQLR